MAEIDDELENVLQRQRTRTRTSAADQEMIVQGASVHQLTLIFGMKHQDVSLKLAGLEPLSYGAQGNPRYAIKEAAARLIKVPLTAKQIDKAIRSMNHMSLPPALSKLYWDAMTVRRKYEHLTGELWYTDEVVSKMGEVLQLLRMRTLMLTDNLDRESPLTDAQRRFLRKATDGMLEAMHDLLVKNFSKARLIDERGRDLELDRSGDSSEDDESL